jgi:hypothetical protein
VERHCDCHCVNGDEYKLGSYDTLYIPRGAEFHISNLQSDIANVMQCSATAENVHRVHHSSFAEYSEREDRIRPLAGKDVFLMFDVPEATDKLIAGYTFVQAHQRSWPPRGRQRRRYGHNPDDELSLCFLAGESARIHLMHCRGVLLGR